MKIHRTIAGALAVGALAAVLSVLGGGVAYAADPSDVCTIQTSGGFYVEATFGGGRTTDAMVTDQRGIGDFMKFKLVPDGLGHYGLQTKSGNYVTAENSGGLTTAVTRDVLHTNATLLQDWERFTLVPQAGSRIFALQARDGHFLTALGAGGQHSAAFNSNATRVGSWERFHIVCGA
jgi:hypothetical protein